MSQDRWTAVDEYVAKRLSPRDEVLEAALADAEVAGLPSISVAPNQGKLLTMLARIHGARRILEIGTLAGYSTICLARGMATDGRLITLEYEPKHADVARGNLRRAGFADRVEVRVGRAIDLLPGTQADGPFDLVFIDADKQSTPDYFAWALRMSRPGTVIVVDNAIRGGAIADLAVTHPDVLGMRRFYEMAAAEPRVTATALQTVGVKGYDGFAIAIVDG